LNVAAGSTRMFSLDRAGDVTVEITPAGLRVAAVTPGPGWREWRRFPRGPVARRRPASVVAVILRQGPEAEHAYEEEFSLQLRDDGRYEVGRRQTQAAARLALLDLGAGRLRAGWDGRRLVLDGLETTPGWELLEVDGPNDFDEAGWDLVVRWGRDDHEVMVAVDCARGEHPPGIGTVDVDRIQILADPLLG
jgi:hypothetical protein